MTGPAAAPPESPGPSGSPSRPRSIASRYRLLAASAAGLLAVLVGVLLFGNLNGNLVYYLEPDEAVAQRATQAAGTRFQLGGLVAPGSVATAPGVVRFEVSTAAGPGGTRIPVEFRGAPAQLFGAGVGVVLEGSWRGATFASDSMKVKHDENYRPPPPGERSR